ncbi:hypothetical protein MP228_010889 [Amoeboaphelidium protococcarum]|nr:hypothetical protein MP228_010889 [Amoeboaphelidium protococcarum]
MEGITQRVRNFLSPRQSAPDGLSLSSSDGGGPSSYQQQQQQQFAGFQPNQSGNIVLSDHRLSVQRSNSAQTNNASSPSAQNSTLGHNHTSHHNNHPRSNRSSRPRPTGSSNRHSIGGGGGGQGASASPISRFFNGLAVVTGSGGGSNLSSSGESTSNVFDNRPPDAAFNNINTDIVVDESLRFNPEQTVRIRLTPYNPYFPVIEKDIYPNATVPIGRYQRHADPEDPYHEGIYFRSTVVSRKHAQLILKDGQLFVKDIKSLGGSFINSVRLSPAGKESTWARLNLLGGDVLQFGVDYRADSTTGQVRNKDRCVELRVEILTSLPGQQSGGKGQQITSPQKPKKWVPANHQHTECCICLSRLYQQQALFIAPCQHTFHYRCIAPLLHQRSGGLFSCPLCRQENDLVGGFFEADDDDDSDSDDDNQHLQRNASQQQQPNGNNSNGGVQSNQSGDNGDLQHDSSQDGDDYEEENYETRNVGGLPVISSTTADNQKMPVYTASSSYYNSIEQQQLREQVQLQQIIDGQQQLPPSTNAIRDRFSNSNQSSQSQSQQAVVKVDNDASFDIHNGDKFYNATDDVADQDDDPNKLQIYSSRVTSLPGGNQKVQNQSAAGKSLASTSQVMADNSNSTASPSTNPGGVITVDDGNDVWEVHGREARRVSSSTAKSELGKVVDNSNNDSFNGQKLSTLQENSVNIGRIAQRNDEDQTVVADNSTADQQNVNNPGETTIFELYSSQNALN